MGLDISVIRAGKSNMFLSPLFRQTLSNIANASIELYNTDGSQGAARGAAFGAGYYKTFGDAFRSLTKVGVVNPDKSSIEPTAEIYARWLNHLQKFL